MSTRTQRQSSLSSLSEAKQIVDGIPLGQVDPEQVVQVARRVYEGGGVQRRFQELCISGAPYTSFPSEGDGPQTVRQVTALLGHLDTIHIGSLKPSACGCFISAAPGSLITFCKGSCASDEDDGVSKCVECGTALSTRRLRFGEELFAVGIKDTEHAGGEEGGVTGMGKVCLGALSLAADIDQNWAVEVSRSQRKKVNE